MSKGNESSSEEVETYLFTVLSRISVPPRDPTSIRLSHSLDSDLNVDSLGFVELLLEIENHYHITFDDDFLFMGSYPDVKSLLDYLLERVELDDHRYIE